MFWAFFIATRCHRRVLIPSMGLYKIYSFWRTTYGSLRRALEGRGSHGFVVLGLIAVFSRETISCKLIQEKLLWKYKKLICELITLLHRYFVAFFLLLLSLTYINWIVDHLFLYGKYNLNLMDECSKFEINLSLSFFYVEKVNFNHFFSSSLCSGL